MEKKFSIEEGFKELDEITTKMEKPDTSLDEAFALYKSGVEIISKCKKEMDLVEKKILKIKEDGTVEEFK